MIQRYSRYKILREFLECPLKDFHMRELSRITKITQPTVMNHLKALTKEGLIFKEKKGIYPTYGANRDSDVFKFYKKFNLILSMQQSGLLDYIKDSCNSDVIILFGSASRGEDTEKSDIDLYVQSREKDLGLSKYEKVLHKEINIFFEENFSRLSNELKNNILNGIVLDGYLKVF